MQNSGLGLSFDSAVKIQVDKIIGEVGITLGLPSPRDQK
jgi:hypothetical protein